MGSRDHPVRGHMRELPFTAFTTLLICDYATFHLQYMAPVSQGITLNTAPLVNMRHSLAVYGPRFTGDYPEYSVPC